jgi:hypothetical protein
MKLDPVQIFSFDGCNYTLYICDLRAHNGGLTPQLGGKQQLERLLEHGGWSLITSNNSPRMFPCQSVWNLGADSKYA